MPSLQVWRSRPLVSAPGRGATAQVRLFSLRRACVRSTWVHGSRSAGELLAAAFRSFLHTHDCSGLLPCAGYWGNDLSSDAKRAENLEAYKALVDNGVSLIDTAEVRHCFVMKSHAG